MANFIRLSELEEAADGSVSPAGKFLISVDAIEAVYDSHTDAGTPVRLVHTSILEDFLIVEESLSYIEGLLVGVGK